MSTGGPYGTTFFDAAPTASVVNCKDVNPVFRPQGAKSYVHIILVTNKVIKE